MGRSCRCLTIHAAARRLFMSHAGEDQDPAKTPPSPAPQTPKRISALPRAHAGRALPLRKILFQLSITRSDQTGLNQGGETAMKLGTAIAEIIKREGIAILFGYPVNHLIEHAANADIRPVMVRQERIGLHMADAISRVTSGHSIGAFCLQHGPGPGKPLGGVPPR